MKVPLNCSWTWRTLLNLRPYLSPYIRVKLSPSSTANFWSVPWMVNGLILGNIFTSQQIVQSGISANAKASDYIHDGKLQMPYSSNQVIRAVWNSFQDNIYLSSASDEILWYGKQHTISSVYKLLDKAPVPPAIKWHKVIWTVNSSARDNFMLWKVINKALLTKDKLLSYGMAVDPICVICKMQPESVDHLFLDCSELRGLWTRLHSSMNNNHNLGHSSLQWDLIGKATKWKKKDRFVHFFMIKKYMRLVWEERNQRCFENNSRNNLQLWNALKASLRNGMRDSKFDFSDYCPAVWT